MLDLTIEANRALDGRYYWWLHGLFSRGRVPRGFSSHDCAADAYQDALIVVEGLERHGLQCKVTRLLQQPGNNVIEFEPRENR